jgi:YD repeat-containing protein
MLYFGSNIGNFSPEELRTILRTGSSQMRPKGGFLVGADLVKHGWTVVAGYDDRTGATAAFNVKISHRLNRELGGYFDPAGFRHRARWNASDSRIEMHLESMRAQGVSITGAQRDLHCVKREMIHTENSYEFTDESVSSLVRDSGLEISQALKDARKVLARRY